MTFAPFVVSSQPRLAAYFKPSSSSTKTFKTTTKHCTEMLTVPHLCCYRRAVPGVTRSPGRTASHTDRQLIKPAAEDRHTDRQTPLVTTVVYTYVCHSQHCLACCCSFILHVPSRSPSNNLNFSYSPHC
jgi:hypothetical protein